MISEKKNLKTGNSKASSTKEACSSLLLGQHEFECGRFEELEKILENFKKDEFVHSPTRHRFRQINSTLLTLIQNAPDNSFLLAAVVDYIEQINQGHFLTEAYRFNDFEFWLNNFSGLNEADNYRVRSKIVGKFIPRGDYQNLFPIGNGKAFPGSHFVTAHISPDVDTTVASLWGWLDAFGARVGQSLHIWSLPGGAPDSHITRILQSMFSKGFFHHTIRSSGSLTLTGMDLLTQEGFQKRLPDTLTSYIEPNINQDAIVLVDKAGHYLGDWHSRDIGSVRQVVVNFSTCLRWFENNLHVKLIAFFTKTKPRVEDVAPCLSSLFDMPISECEPVKDFSTEQKNYLNDYLQKVLQLSNGLKSSFGNLSDALEALSIHEFSTFRATLNSLQSPELFDKSGILKEDRPKIFHFLQQIIQGLDDAIQSVRTYVDRLDVMMETKRLVLGHHAQFITLRSDVEEIRLKMKNYGHLTVVIPEKDGHWFPVGIVKANDLRMPLLGTVSQRDFCNHDEIKMAPYLEVISVIDHHKSALKTSTAPLALIGDAQSCNVLIAEQMFVLNDRYSLGGMNLEDIHSRLKELASLPPSPTTARLQRRTLERQIAAHNRGHYHINPKREYAEYLCFLYAILDDTDLLSKVTNRDIACVVELLNRLKSLSVGKDVEIIAVDDIPKDRFFAKKAAAHILKNKDMYSLYKRIYDLKELDVEHNLEACARGESSNVFSDTKEQNGCSRVGQIKLFTSNFTTFHKHADTYRRQWLSSSREFIAERPEVDLYIQMVSTITGADEVYSGKQGDYKHKDEIWIWMPSTELAAEHLSSFLISFSTAPEVINNQIEVEFLGENATELDPIFAASFSSFPRKFSEKFKSDLPIAILRFNAATINSRKSSITPYIPQALS